MKSKKFYRKEVSVVLFLFPYYKTMKEETVKKVSFVLTLLIVGIALMAAVPNSALAAAKISATEYKVGDTVTIEGSIEPGKDLYVTVVSHTTFAPKDTDGVHEVARLKKEAQKKRLHQ
jgi:hypothetical protein